MLDKIYRGNTDEFIQDCIHLYTKQGFCIVNFLYFANLIKYRLLEEPKNQTDIVYKNALLQADFLLPDGIALQVWDKYSSHGRQNLKNLNGTDLTPHFLEYLATHHKDQVELYLVSVYDPTIKKGPERLEKAKQKMNDTYGFEKIYTHQTLYADRGKNFPFDEWAKGAVEKGNIRVLLHCTGTPFQELWSDQHRQWIKDNNILMMNVGGFIDFFAGFEKRAPKRAVKARVLETPWRIMQNPAKNLKKFLVMFGVVRLLRKNITKRDKKKV